MKGKKHTPEQINGGATIGQVCQKLGISEPTFHRWREQYVSVRRTTSSIQD